MTASLLYHNRTGELKALLKVTAPSEVELVEVANELVRTRRSNNIVGTHTLRIPGNDDIVIEKYLDL